jgi:sugar (pentulose or hexulose) kinase
MTHPPLTLGIDFGTSGCRAVAVDRAGKVRAQASITLPASTGEPPCREQQPADWWSGLKQLLQPLGQQIILTDIQCLAINGTSASLVLTDADGAPLSPALMYNDSRANAVAARIGPLLPADSGAHGASSALAKALWWLQQHPEQQPAHACHQADWISGRLLARFGVSDENNCLKLGYDPIQRQWPDWMQQLPDADRLLSILPVVKEPGTGLGKIDPTVAAELGLDRATRIAAGTTDSVAAFIAAGPQQPGDAVTSLGSTLALKMLSDRPVFDRNTGVYSHRLGELWLAGGASNTGGAVLLHFFSPEQIRHLSSQLQPDQPTGLHYYPLVNEGERFPVNDPQMLPQLTPRPDDDRIFFQAILESIADIEARGYQLLTELGAPALQHVFTTGGGAGNEAWQQMRRQRLGVAVIQAEHDAAAYGSALLARKAVENKT